jgi:hypothetical protein
MMMMVLSFLMPDLLCAFAGERVLVSVENASIEYLVAVRRNTPAMPQPELGRRCLPATGRVNTACELEEAA